MGDWVWGCVCFVVGVRTPAPPAAMVCLRALEEVKAVEHIHHKCELQLHVSRTRQREFLVWKPY